MPPTQSLVQSLTDDIVAFADPFTDPKIKIVKGKIRIEIIRNGRNMSFDINQNSWEISANHRNRSYGNLKALLASDEFSNIERFAETQLRAFEKQPQKQASAIPSAIKCNNELLTIEDLTTRLLTDIEKTRLLLLDGPAGVGKTFQLEQIAISQALKCKNAGIAPPLLHISSRGRRLSNFRDVLAATTQDMGASFGARQVPILVRHGILIAAIDGFDELVDADGYEDAWLALREFIDQVGQGGAIVLAARDTFVEEQELLIRIHRTSASVALMMGHIQPPGANEAKQWLSKSPHWKLTDIESNITDDILREGSYALRPFFLRILREAGGWRDILQSGPRTYLINSLVSRESKLIAQQLGGTTAEKIAPALISFFQEIALEMSTRETDSVEIDHLGFLVRYCFSDVLDEVSIQKLMHKAGSFSLLESSHSKERRKFSHSEIQYYFLGGAIIKLLEARTVPMVLRRSALGAEHLSVFAEVFLNDGVRAKRASAFLSATVNSEISADGLATNGGAILILAFSLGLIDRLDFISAIDAILAGDSPEGEFAESQISRFDITGADISSVRFDNVSIGTLVVDSATKFGLSHPKIDALEIREKGQIRVERDRDNISKFIALHARSTTAEYANSEMVRLLERIARRAIRYFYLREHGDDDDGAFLLKDSNWPIVRSVLEKNNRIEAKKGRQMHGRPSALLRIVQPVRFLDYSDMDTKKIFDELMAIEGETLYKTGLP